MSKLPAVPKGQFKDAGQQRYADSLQNFAEILSGRKGTGMDRAVLVRDLVDQGLVTLKKGANGKVSVGGPAAGLFPDPGTERFNTPPAPVNFQVNGAFSNIILTWDKPTYTEASATLTEIYRNSVNELSTAVQIAAVQGVIYGDSVGVGAGYYYWVRHINVGHFGAQKAGPYNDANGIHGETNPDIGAVIDDLTQQILDSPLFQEMADQDFQDYTQLQATINQVQNALTTAETDLNASIDSVNAKVDSNKATLQVNINTLNDALNQAKAELDIADENHATAITDLEQTVLDGDSALSSRINALDVAYKAADSAAAANVIAVEQALLDADSALASRLDSVEADYKAADTEAAANLATLEQVVTDADTAMAQRIDTVEADYKAADTAASGRINSLEQVVTDGDSALAERIDQVEVDYKAGDTAAHAAITAAETALASADQALAERIDQFQVEYGDFKGTVTEQATVDATTDRIMSKHLKVSDTSYTVRSEGEKIETNAKISTLEQTLVDANGALASRVDIIEANYKSADTATNAALTSLAEAVANNESASASRMDQIEASYKAADDGLADDIATANASITSLSSTVASSNNALSQRVTNVESDIDGEGGLSARLQTAEQAIATINDDGSEAYQALWNVKATAGDIDAGIGLVAGSNGTSQVMIAASQVFAYDPNNPTGSKTPMFAIDNGAVIMPRALIEKAAIQVLESQTIIADQVVAGVSVTSPAITGGALNGTTLNVNDNFVVNSAGTMTAKNAVITGSTFAGTLSAATGTFAGSLSAATGTFRGTLSAAGGTFNGTVYAKNLIGDVTAGKTTNIGSGSWSSSSWKTIASFSTKSSSTGLPRSLYSLGAIAYVRNAYENSGGVYSFYGYWRVINKSGSTLATGSLTSRQNMPNLMLIPPVTQYIGTGTGAVTLQVRGDVSWPAQSIGSLLITQGEEFN
ncbi:MAG: DUF1983 domain-containing protein [Photobacterium halotolerans]